MDVAGGGAGACRTSRSLPPSTASLRASRRDSRVVRVRIACSTVAAAIPRRATGVAWRVGVAGIFRGGARGQRANRAFPAPLPRLFANWSAFKPTTAANGPCRGLHSWRRCRGWRRHAERACYFGVTRSARPRSMYWPPVVWWQWAAMMFLPGFSFLAVSGGRGKWS